MSCILCAHIVPRGTIQTTTRFPGEASFHSLNSCPHACFRANKGFTQPMQSIKKQLHQIYLILNTLTCVSTMLGCATGLRGDDPLVVNL